MRLKAALLASAALLAPQAHANEFTPMLEALVDSEIRGVVSDPVLIDAIRAQNAETAGLSEADILERDTRWRAEIGGAETPMIDRVLTGPAAERLRAAAAESGGLFTEIFVMDAVGLNVAASGVTSDYWQGDEAKWQETYPTGAHHIGEIELDESTQAFQSQVSVAILDPENGTPIGAATFGVNIELLQ